MILDRDKLDETSQQVLKKRKKETEVTLAASGDFSQRRSGRVQSRNEKRREEMRKSLPTGLSHFGLDASPFIQEAMDEGGKLDKSRREELSQMMNSNKLTGDKLADVLPKPFVPQVESTFSGRSFIQKDARDIQSKGYYEGSMFTSSFVNPSSDIDPKEKEIPRPSSPRPDQYGKSEAHQSHAAPFSLIGPDSNQAKTVWNSQWANIGVDSRIEKAALSEHKGGSEVVHFRFDTDTHSSVGMVSKQLTGGFSSQTMTYQRRNPEEKK
jgi:hypothetical protein